VLLLAGEKNIELVSPAVPDGLTVTGDQSWLEQVIVNLLSNAIKFSPKDCKIDITAQIDKTGKFAEIAIKDQGPGIDESEKSLIFERFHRVSSKNGVEGSGLGLAICKELVELHDGYIRIDSVPKEGSTFTVGIPLAPEGTNLVSG
jgi:two-component system sensor histidine kinase KdpD